jgi:hypothetical protein
MNGMRQHTWNTPAEKRLIYGGLLQGCTQLTSDVMPELVVSIQIYQHMLLMHVRDISHSSLSLVTVPGPQQRSRACVPVVVPTYTGIIIRADHDKPMARSAFSCFTCVAPFALRSHVTRHLQLQFCISVPGGAAVHIVYIGSAHAFITDSCRLCCMVLLLRCAAPVYLGCFRYETSEGGNPRGLPNLLQDEMDSSNTTEQCWQLALGERSQQLPLFGIRGRQCFGGNDLGLATSTTPARDADCLAGDPNVRGPSQRQHFDTCFRSLNTTCSSA